MSSPRTLPVFAGRWRAGAGLLAPVLLPFAVSRLLVLIGAVAGQYGLRPGLSPYPWRIAEAWLEPIFKWDAAYYLGIANSGYQSPDYAAFFPLYPLLGRLLAPLVGGVDPAVVLISNLALLVALALIHRIGTELIGAPRAALAAWLLVLNPWSFFLSAPYAESLFLALAAATLLLIGRDRLLAAGVTAALAAADRGQGFLLAASFAAEAAQRFLGTAGPNLAARLRAARVAPLGAALVLALAGLAAVALVEWRTLGDPLLFLSIQKHWVAEGRSPVEPLRVFVGMLRHPELLNTEWAAVPLLLLWVAAAGWTVLRLPWRYGLFTASLVLLAIWHGIHIHQFFSVPRHLLVTFPAFFALAVWLHRPRLRLLTTAILVLSGGWLVFYTALYASWRFVG